MTVEEIHAPPSFDGSDGLLALIVRPDPREPEGVQFVTPPGLSQQVAYIHHPPGHAVEPHRHLPCERRIAATQEVLLVRRGLVRVDFFTSLGEPVGSRTLNGGDVLVLVAGGHGFEVIGPGVEFFEVKQGPYHGKARDKESLPKKYHCGEFPEL